MTNQSSRVGGSHSLYVDKNGNLPLTEEQRIRWGLMPGSEIQVRETGNGLVLFPADPPLKKVYVEPTTACNLNCRTCMRNSWDESTGYMEMTTYGRLVEGLREARALQTVAFWGMGEPLLHPGIVDMVTAAKHLGARTELISNGLLLDRKKAAALIAAGLDTLVISVDGASPESHAEVRTGAYLGQVQANVAALHAAKYALGCHTPEVGIEFVLTRRNLSEIGNLRSLALRLGASFIIVTNVMPYTEELRDEILYWLSADRPWSDGRSEFLPAIVLPRFDARRENLEGLTKMLWLGGAAETIRNLQRDPLADGYCRFVEEGAAAVAWDGSLSPCIALLHSYRCYVFGREKRIRRYSLGNVAQEDIMKIRDKEEYRDFRKRVLNFQFSPCATCGGCDFQESNEEDCFGNPHPVCGDCLWARNIILCP